MIESDLKKNGEWSRKKHLSRREVFTLLEFVESERNILSSVPSFNSEMDDLEFFKECYWFIKKYSNNVSFHPTSIEFKYCRKFHDTQEQHLRELKINEILNDE